MMRRCRGQSSIRGIHGLRDSRILYREELDVHVNEVSSKTVPGFTRHAPSFLPGCPLTELDVLQMVRIFRVRRFIARPSGAYPFRFPFGRLQVHGLSLFITIVGYFKKICSKLNFPARVAPRNQDVRFDSCSFIARVAPRKNLVLRMAYHWQS